MLAELKRSAFLSDVGPDDRRLGRVLLTLVLGGLAAAAAAVLAGGLVFGGFALGSGDPAMAGRLMAAIENPAVLAGSLSMSLFLFCMLAGANGAMAVAFTGVAARLHHRRLRTYLTAAPRFRWRMLTAGLLLFSMIVGPVVVLAGVLDPEPMRPPILTLVHTPAGRLAYAAAATVLLVIAATAEELVFRGWLLKLTSGFLRNPWLLLLVNGALFSAIHFDPNLDAFLVRAAMGMGLVWMTLRLGGLEFAIGAHAANNILILLLVRPMTLADPAHPFAPASLLVAPLMFAGYAGLAELVARVPVLRRLSGLERTPIMTTAAAAPRP